MNEEKEELERGFQRKFEQIYADYPVGETTKADPPYPDFLIRTGPDLIGLEVTEIYQDSGEHGSLLQQRLMVKAKINEGVLKKLTPLLGFNFIIDIQLYESKRFQNSDLRTKIDEVVDCCVKLFSDMGPNQCWKFHNIEIDLNGFEARDHVMAQGYRNLPELIESISLDRIAGLKKSVHFYNEAGMVPNLTKDVLLPVLKNKDAKIDNYETCDQYWLLIVEGRYRPQHFHEVQVAVPIISRYDRVFLLRIMESEVVVLK